MLVLSRRTGEEIVITKDGKEYIRLLVNEIRAHRPAVRIGIEAPKDIGVFRLEVWDAIQREGAAAMRHGVGSDGEGKIA